MKWQVTKIRAYRVLRMAVLYALYASLTITVVGFVLLQIPAVQENLIDRYTRNISKGLGFQISADKFYLRWYDHLEIQRLEIKDTEHNTMIAVEHLDLNFRFTSILDNDNINIDAAQLSGVKVYLKTIQESDTSTNLNLNIFIDRLNGPPSTTTKQPPKINIGEIDLEDADFSYNETESDSIKSGFDYHHFKMDVAANLRAFNVIGDTIQFHVNSLKATDKKTGLQISHLKTFFLISQTSMEFLGLNANVGKSFIADTIVFKYKSQADLSNFNRKVTINAKLKNTVIHPDDLALFTSGTSPIPSPLELGGNFNGKISRFNYQNIIAKLGSTSIEGNLQMDGLPSVADTFIELDIKQGDVDINDLAFLLPEKIFDVLSPLRRFELKGKFTGFPTDFVANGDFSGRLGKIKSDINLKINKAAIEKSYYAGRLSLQDFHLGEYLQDTATFQNVYLNGRIKGTGLTKASADFFLDGKINAIGIFGYPYKNIETSAQFARELFNGRITIDDPHLQFVANGSIDLRKGINRVKVKALLDTAQLDRLGLIGEPLGLRTFLDIDTQGLQLDSIFGDAKFRNTSITYRSKSLKIDSIHLTSALDQIGRVLRLRSSSVDAILKGHYYYSTLFKDLNRLFTEFKLNVQNDKTAIATYYNEKAKSVQDYQADFDLLLHDINPFIELAGLDATLSKNTKITGQFTNGITSVLNAYTSVDTVRIGSRIFTGNEIEFSGSKIRDSVNVLAILSITSKKQQLTNTFTTRDLFSEIVWNKDHINLNLDANQVGNDNQIRLKSEIDFLDDSIKLKILPTRIRALDKEWTVNERNFLLNKGKEWSIHDLEIRNQNESILLSGVISERNDELLTLQVRSLNLNILDAISQEKFNGIVNGEVKIRDFYSNPFLQNNISIDGLSVNNFLIGDLIGKNTWNSDKQQFDIDFTIDRSNQRIVSLVGFYNPKENSPLAVRATLAKTNLKIVEPFLRGIFSQIDGTLSGEYQITGDFTKPLINGAGTIEDGQIMIDYLQTLYGFSGKLGMSPSKIVFDDIVLKDAFKNTSTLAGYLTHKNYSNFRINLNAEFTNFQLLNTSQKDNNLFYGQAYATGDLNILGPLENMKISATARSEKKTRILIPMNSTQSAEKKDFITFVNMTEQAKERKEFKAKAKSKPTGITMDLNLDLTPDAYSEIIFDAKSGDIIRGYGRGDIRLQLDTKGEFTMFGLYEFDRGYYNFTLYDVINKEFTINAGSRISWTGDPYTGQLALNASYKQLTSLGPILTNPTEANSLQMRRKYPVDVLLKLEGPMLSPQINFDIVANELPNSVPMDQGQQAIPLKMYFQQFKAKLDEQELQKQVFSLIILRRFSPLDAFTASGADLTRSVSELLSNQLSYWLTQVDENLEIDFDLPSFDQEAFNTFQLRLSYSFFGGRLRVTRDGTFGNQYARSDVSNLLGDWTVDYLLTPDGKFKVKMFNRTNINQLVSSLGTQATISAGVSLAHTQNFNNWLELITRTRERKRREMKIGEDQENDAKKDKSD